MRALPGSLVTQTSLLLIVGLAIIELTGLGIHALDRLDLAERSQTHGYQIEVLSLYHTVAQAPESERQATVDDLHLPTNMTVSLLQTPDPDIQSHKIHFPFVSQDNSTEWYRTPEPGPAEIENTRGLRPFHWPLISSTLTPQEVWSGKELRTLSTSLLLPDRQFWVVIRYTLPLPNPLDGSAFIIAFLVMSLLGIAIIVWAARRLISPVITLANAAEALGQDVNNASLLPENGPSEIRRAALAFNTMSMRVRRFVSNRTLMLTAIGHDLRTPITRLKLRAEFIDDDELRGKILSDLDEMEAMVSATLAFGRDSASAEPAVSLDLRTLLQTIVDEAAESQPQKAHLLAYDPPPKPVHIRAQSVALKRALNNLILNALNYGGNTRIHLLPPQTQNKSQILHIFIEDTGPGLPETELERVFEPFVRIETSRNRETGGTGLGLAIARTILRAQGGDVHLQNRSDRRGLRAIIVLPA